MRERELDERDCRQRDRASRYEARIGEEGLTYPARIYNGHRRYSDKDGQDDEGR